MCPTMLLTVKINFIIIKKKKKNVYIFLNCFFKSLNGVEKTILN